ncbi:DeoR/GlpR family DNA-binding transcription regulator [Sphingomonas sp. RHCKR7]|uniref:DeoR/GlpR family DNA-binding transcription regulator n=1 Tax=Sphingomonas folli TaxID=2862497 RepID=UPI001C68685B|nr:DeoR/GlpR family DNA-binding transcription regulator [Sphingomonas folli]MBW6528905.1 DeoR/GlpR family DNA-binding transcription regulator [Sphingomonas folli]
MTQFDRIARLVALLERQGSCAITELATHFAVSEETIRRDVRLLEAEGRAFKVHGGVTLPDGRRETPVLVRMREQAEAKRAVAHRAASLIEDGMTVLIDSGTTSCWLARALTGFSRLTVVTNSLEVAGALLNQAGVRVHLAGGALNADYRAAFDREAVRYARGFAPDATILSMGAIDAARGFLDFDPDEAGFKRALLDVARRVVVVADSSKFVRAGTIHVADFAQVADLVADGAIPDPIVTAAARAGTRLHRA